MSVVIRKAIKDDAIQVVSLIYKAIGEIANRLTGESDVPQVIDQLEVLFCREDTRHSYLNTYVAVKERQPQNVLGTIVLYSGMDGLYMDALLKRWLEQKNSPVTQIDPEAHLDEFYVDTICVHETCRGLGIGTKLLQFAQEIARHKGFNKLSLNVETENVSARRLYERFGFVVTEPWTIIDEHFSHMVKIL